MAFIVATVQRRRRPVSLAMAAACALALGVASAPAAGSSRQAMAAAVPTGHALSAAGPTGHALSAAGPTGQALSAAGPTGQALSAAVPRGQSTAAAVPTGHALSAAGPLGPAMPAPGATGSLTGQVTAPPPAGSATPVAVAGIAVTATGPAGVTYSTTTAADGFYALDHLPAPSSYRVIFTPPAGGVAQTQASATISTGAVTTVDDSLGQPVATVTGEVVDRHGHPLAGIPITLAPTGASCPSAAPCGPSTSSDSDGRYAISVVAGTYALEIQDGSRSLRSQTVDAAAGQQAAIVVRLPAAAVPLGTAAEHARRDLSWLNAERTQAGVPAAVVLNRRWALDCAAHDAYEGDNGVLSHAENPQAFGASPGGAWAGLVSVLAQSRWNRLADPWQSAPIHLMQLLTPSLSVVGIDDSSGRQCVTTSPGLLRTPLTTDTVLTYPAAGARGVPPSENAREAPFVPGQFVGIPAGTTAGRELFVYLNEAEQIGQAQVMVLSATLSQGGRPAPVRWVDNSSRNIGRYLTGAILIPVKPLRGRTTYSASVVVQDRSGSLTHTWSFTTARR